MLNNVVTFWNLLPSDTRAFIITVASNMAVKLFPDKKIKSNIKKEFDEAFQEGFKHFIPHFGENCSYFIIDLLKDEQAISYLADIIKDESAINNTSRLEDSISRAGIDINTIDGFDINSAIASFRHGFMQKAEFSEKMLSYLNFQELKKITSSLKPTAEPVDLTKLREIYFKYLKEKFSYIGFKGLSEGKLLSFPLKKLYTNLTFSEDRFTTTDISMRKGEKISTANLKIHEQQKSIVSLSEILNYQYAVITGAPGAGKSTLLKYIALRCADDADQNGMETEKNFMPILFPVAAFMEGIKKSSLGYSLDNFIFEYFKGVTLSDLTPLFSSAIGKARAIFLIDGLDEVSDESERKKAIEKIRDYMFKDNHSKSKYIITCRTASYTKASRFEPVSGKEFTHFRALPFALEQIENFLLNWYRLYQQEVYRRDETLEVEAKKNLNKMLIAIKGDKNILSIATNPLMLTILALIEHEGGKLPENRTDLYAKCLTMFAGAWENERSLYEEKKCEFKLDDRRITDKFIVDFLGHIAFSMHNLGTHEIEHNALKDALAAKFDTRNKDIDKSKEQADNFISILKERSGIINEAAIGIYSFSHPTFKEYLTARVLTDLSKDRIKDLGENLFKPEWREVVLLTAGSLKKRDATDFVTNIMKKDTQHADNLVLAGECILDIGRDRVFDELYDELVKNLLDVATGTYPIDEKVKVGEIMGWLGDPRNLQEFIKIKGGEYNLENIGKVNIRPFEISRYPVTNGWYEKFIQAKGYEKKEYWSPEGEKWLAHTKAKEPRLWNDRKWRCPSAPVVGVCWYEADAFARWLSAELNDGFQYRLLTETEWQAVAAGKNRRQYPWGNEWDKNRCNNGEIKIEKISPVGIFSKGETPEGVADMSGNVWEWTLSDYHSKKDMNDFTFDAELQKLWDEGKYGEYSSRLDEKKRKIPVLRGGSWFIGSYDCRCASRYGGYPYGRLSDIGFRCART